MPKVSLRVHIFSYIIILLTLIVLIISGVQYYFSKQLALKATKQNFHLIASHISSELQSRDIIAKEILYQMQNFPDIQQAVDERNREKVVKRYIYTLKRIKNIHAIYSGNKKDEFIEVVKLSHSKRLMQYFGAPKGASWLSITVKGEGDKRAGTLIFYDEKLHKIASRKEPTDYHPLQRPWYQSGMRTDKAVRGKPYLFNSLQEHGVTFAKRVDHTSTVLALDLSLKDLTNTLEGFHFADSSEIVMFGSDGKLIASSAPSETLHSDYIKTFIAKPKKHMMDFNHGQRYIMVKQLSIDNGYTTYLGVSVKKRELLQPYFEQIIYSLLVAFGLFILSFPLTLFIVNLIAKPLVSLMVENNKIRERKFNEVREIDTNIIELNRLSQLLVEMSKSIYTYQEAQKELMDAFIKLIADAIDAKSPYTGGHCKRVPLIATMLVEAAGKSDKETLKNFQFTTDEEFEEFERGAWLHDCGKITTPEYVVDKATKLETIYNRIHEVRMRFEVLWRDLDIRYLEAQLSSHFIDELHDTREKERQKLLDDFNFIATINVGGEFMSEEKKRRVEAIAKRTWLRHFDDRLGLSDNELMRYTTPEKRSYPIEERLLDDRSEHIVPRVDFDEAGYRAEGFKLDVPKHQYNYGEIYNLCIERGTLTTEERFKIQEHVIMSIKMLEQLPFTEDMKRIPEYAGTHHETLIGTGYPRALDSDALSVPARVMAIADIFEALTASDRPYKKGKTLSQALKIMSFMVKDQHIDAELFALFLERGIYMQYAKQHLKAEQVDDVDIALYL